MPSHALHAPVLDWYRASARDLPWRADDATPWGVLVSEVMLQQTPVARVLPVWRQWMARWPSPATLAVDAPGEAVRAWGALGYPRRALRLHAVATTIAGDHGGRVPDSAAGLRALPGIGPYTAAAVASFAFGRRHAVVDTNVRRVQARAVSGTARPSPALTAAETRLAESLLPASGAAASRWSVAVMELGALVCTARAPRCGACPVAELCGWRAAGSPAPAEPTPRRQPWHGTDRQVRGRLMAVLRSSRDPVCRELLEAAWDDAAQRERCLDALVAEGLAEALPGQRYRLPETTGR
jgi:A/G-specific adenine glycosylase